MSDWILPVIDLMKCNRCGVCVQICPTQALALTSQGPIFENPKACTYCTECEKLCPQGAITCPLQIGWAPDMKTFPKPGGNS